ncbi:MAG: hypothetical protein ACE5EF_13015 [Dehalococcoidia bacterium]
MTLLPYNRSRIGGGTGHQAFCVACHCDGCRPVRPVGGRCDRAERRIYEAELRELLQQHALKYPDELETIGICESGRWDSVTQSW